MHERARGECARRGWKLAILSNTDDDFIAASQVQIGVPFDEIVVAQEIGSYKPAPPPLGRVLRAHARAAEGHVHVAASLFHDIAPCERARAAQRVDQPARETRDPVRSRLASCTDLFALPETLDELVAA